MLCCQWVTDQQHSGSTRGLMGALGLDHLLEPGEGMAVIALSPLGHVFLHNVCALPHAKAPPVGVDSIERQQHP